MSMAKRPRKTQPPLESAEDSYILSLYRAAGMTVISFSQSQKAQQTKGIPDMLVFDTRTVTFFWHEVKRRKGPGWLKVSHGQTPDQKWFQNLVESFGQEYLIGAREVAWEKLRLMGRMK